MKSNMDNKELRMIILSVAVNKLGGELVITQQDIDNVAYNKLIEESGDGKIKFTIEKRTKSS